MSLPAAITKFLEMATCPQSVSEITRALLEGGFKTTSKNLMPIVGSNLSRMKAAGETVNVEGKWGLSSWYPAAPRQPATKPSGRKRGRPKGSAKAKMDKPETKAVTDDQIRQLHAAGGTYRTISKELGVSRAVVWRALKSKKSEGSDAGPDSVSGSKATAEQIEQIKALHAAGKKPGEIAKEIGLHHLAVWSILKQQQAA